MSKSQPPPRFLFLDWAGDAGFKFRRGSSRYLIIAVVFTDDYQTLQDGLDRLREQWELGKGFYFHYVEASSKVRPAFFRVLVSLPFQARVLVVDKPRLSASFRTLGGQKIIQHFVAELVVGLPREMTEGATLIFDGHRRETRVTRGIRVAISHLQKERGLDYHLKRVLPCSLIEEDGVQIADMIAGAALDQVDGTRDVHWRTLGRKVEIVPVPGKENRLG